MVLIEKVLPWILLGAICALRISVAASNVLMATSIVIFVYLCFKKHKYETGWNPLQENNIYYEFWGILFLSMIPSVLFSYDVLLSTKGLFDMWFYRMMPFFIITILIHNKDILERFLIAIFGIYSLECIFAIIQVLVGITDRGRGFSHEPTGLAGILAMIFPIALVCVLDYRIDNTVRKIALISMPIMMGGAIAGQGRALWLSLLITCPIILFKYVISNRRLLVIVCAVFCAITILFVTSPKLSNRFISSVNVTTNVSNTDRIVLWKSSWNMIKDHPITGVGIRCYKDIYRERYMLPEIKQKHLDQSHNNFVQIFSEAGICGFIGFLCFTAFMLYSNIKDWIKCNNPYSLMLFSSWLGFTLIGMTGAIIQVSSMGKLLWFLTGTLIVLKKIYKCDDKYKSRYVL